MKPGRAGKSARPGLFMISGLYILYYYDPPEKSLDAPMCIMWHDFIEISGWEWLICDIVTVTIG